MNAPRIAALGLLAAASLALAACGAKESSTPAATPPAAAPAPGPAAAPAKAPATAPATESTTTKLSIEGMT